MALVWHGDDEEVPKEGEPQFLTLTSNEVRAKYRCRICDQLARRPVKCGNGEHLYCHRCLINHLKNNGWRDPRSSGRIDQPSSGVDMISDVVSAVLVQPVKNTFHSLLRRKSKCVLCSTFRDFRYSQTTEDHLEAEQVRCYHFNRNDITEQCLFIGTFEAWRDHKPHVY